MSQNQLFSFNDLAAKGLAERTVTQFFKQAKIQVVSYYGNIQIKRSNGTAYREMLFAFADNQTVAIRVKESGDIFQVLLNGTLMPIKGGDSHTKALAEIVGTLDANRSKYQTVLSKAMLKMPQSLKTALPDILSALTVKRDNLKVQIEAVNAEILAMAA